MTRDVQNRLLAAFGLLLSLAGCGPEAPAADVAARLADRPVPYAEFEAYLADNAITDAPSLDSAVLSGLFDQFLGELSLTRLAAEEGAAAGGGSRADVSRFVAGATPAIERAEIEAFYEAHLDRFREPERVRVRQILVEDRETAELAARELASGLPFEEVARTLSQGPRARKGGDQGLLGREDLPPELANQIFELEAGQVSEIISVDYGFHIFQVTERLEATDAPLDLARPRILEELQESKRDEAVAALLDRASKLYNVRVYTRNLPFRYQGRYKTS